MQRSAAACNSFVSAGRPTDPVLYSDRIQKKYPPPMTFMGTFLACCSPCMLWEAFDKRYLHTERLALPCAVGMKHGCISRRMLRYAAVIARSLASHGNLCRCMLASKCFDELHGTLHGVWFACLFARSLELAKLLALYSQWLARLATFQRLLSFEASSVSLIFVCQEPLRARCHCILGLLYKLVQSRIAGLESQPPGDA